ncbi:MAG: hypothetical protein K0R38_360 [Polyangiaceae bacterium]|nr:hypothetical protein [Polyangiaceae bacterium]
MADGKIFGFASGGVRKRACVVQNSLGASKVREYAPARHAFGLQGPNSDWPPPASSFRKLSMLSERAALALFVACAFHVTACSDAPVTPPSSVASAGTGGSSSEALGSSGSASGGASTAGQSGAGGLSGAGGAATPAMPCASYMDESGWALLVQIKNERQQVVYLGQKDAQCETSRPFEVRDGTRALLPALEKCQSTCQQLMQSGPTTCALACAAPSTIALQPGETLKVPWDGRFGVPQTLPATCASAAAQGTSACVQAAHIDANVFTFAAHAGTAVQCLAGAAGCTCAPNANGGCIAPGSVMSGTIITTEYLVKLEPGETSPSGEPPYIGLVFRD